MSENKKLFLVDGSGYIFRAYYGIRGMTRPDGVPINAVFGFTSMMMKLLKSNKSSHIAVVFDAARKTFRQDIYKEYKTNRKETPEDLIPQFPIIREAVKAFDIPCLEMEGYEADDLIATYARLGVEKGIEVTIVSADKDLMQLVGTGVKLIDPMKDREIDEKVVFEKFGVTPDKVIEVQALAGDSSDNIPGVPGIGPKIAAELINQFGDVENLLKNASTIKQEKRKRSLIENAELALISKQLVTLKKDVPVTVPVDDLGANFVDMEKVAGFLEKQSFKSLLAKLQEWGDVRNTSISEAKQVTKKYKLITELKELKEFVDKAMDKGIVAIDTETDSLDAKNANIVGISLCYDEGKAVYIPISHKQKGGQQSFLFEDESENQEVLPGQLSIKEIMDMLEPLLVSESVVKIGHNIKYDLHVLFSQKEIDINPIDDTILMAYLVYGPRFGLSMDDLAKNLLQYTTIKFSDVCGTGKNKITFDYVPLEKALEYAAEDADITLRLYNLLKPELLKNELLNIYETIEKPLIKVLFRMERAGIKVDEKMLISVRSHLIKEIAVLEDEIKKLAGEDFNVNSSAQLGEILFDKMDYTGGSKTKEGRWSTDAETLEKLVEEQDSKIAAMMLEYRQMAKINSTYAVGLLGQIDKKTLRIHTDFSQTVTNTGRLSSNNPNLQNIPIRTELGKTIRKAFVAKENHKLISADYSQVELRLIASLAKVEKLKESFLNNEDIHTRTAAYVFGVGIDDVTPELRRNAKAINFGIVYGISPFGLARQLGILRGEAGDYIKSYLGQYPEISEYMSVVKEFAHSYGYVKTFMGRRCYLDGINGSNQSVKNYAERAAINAPMQGGAADIIKMAMIKLDREILKQNLKTKMLLQVHDELLLESPDDEVEIAAKLLKDVMENIVQMDVPLTVDVNIGLSWDK